jgi:plasmid stabilization system protein ParE
MTDRLRLQITALAAQQIRQAEEWWRGNRPAAPNAVRQELESAFSLIASQPQAGGRATNVQLTNVRRVFLPRIKYHVYYHVVGEPPCIEVVAFWHARRGSGPPV